MKTLKEILEEMDKKQWRTVTPNGYFSIPQILDMVEKWLNQNLHTDRGNFESNRFYKTIIEELIKELSL